MNDVQISASGPVDNLGEPHENGEYISIFIRSGANTRRFKVLLNSAFMLAREIDAAIWRAGLIKSAEFAEHISQTDQFGKVP